MRALTAELSSRGRVFVFLLLSPEKKSGLEDARCAPCVSIRWYKKTGEVFRAGPKKQETEIYHEEKGGEGLVLRHLKHSLSAERESERLREILEDSRALTSFMV